MWKSKEQSHASIDIESTRYNRNISIGGAAIFAAIAFAGPELIDWADSGAMTEEKIVTAMFNKQAEEQLAKGHRVVDLGSIDMDSPEMREMKTQLLKEFEDSQETKKNVAVIASLLIAAGYAISAFRADRKLKKTKKIKNGPQTPKC